MKITLLLTTLFLTIINVHNAEADTLVGYNVMQTYSDGTTFSGSFAFNYTKQIITNLSGTLYDNAMKAPPLPLTYQRWEWGAVGKRLFVKYNHCVCSGFNNDDSR